MHTVSHMIKLDWLSAPALSLFFGGLLWVVSLTQVAFYTDQGAVMGYWVGATGWLGFAMFQFAWYANLLELLGVLLMARYPNRAMLLAVMGVIVAGHAFWFTDIPGHEIKMHIVGLGAGFWLWYASMVLITLGVIFGSGQPEQPDE
ncbi:hypothetical protein J9253_19245 [Thiothrix litoralis]|uniref:DoxX family protein n=1 Tax=Thiothrix litoralis TaxID=2891210 RepID=A0ABX7WRK4_9GAMM|nr:hypothetical protein [Thiothrix litoralis]QTR46087.1 hypothetical protein J9253_19245 [Thiothrix litoralis]